MLLRIRICHESENADEIADYFKIKDYHKRVVWRYELLSMYVYVTSSMVVAWAEIKKFILNVHV